MAAVAKHQSAHFKRPWLHVTLSFTAKKDKECSGDLGQEGKTKPFREKEETWMRLGAESPGGASAHY